MTAVCLKAENARKTERWSSVFTGFNTDAKSCLFIRQLTSTCISTILHLRNVLSDEYFETKNFEGMALKLLKTGKENNYGSKIEQWLEGAFEAVEKKYLKRLMLDIQDAETNMTLEIYTMTFNYNREKKSINALLSESTVNNDSCFTTANTKLNTIKLLQMCHAVTQTYSPLPSQVKLSMRLSYYENTPEDYQPKGYVVWQPEEPKFPKPARGIEIGIASTQHHFFKLFNKSCLSDKFFKEMEDPSNNSNPTLPLEEIQEAQQNKSVTKERQTKAKRELCFDKPKNSDTNLLVTSDKKTEATFVVTEKCVANEEGSKPLKGKTRKNSVLISDVKNEKVRCACLSSDKTEKMFSCMNCKFLVHAECFGILQFDPTKKIRFNCHLCHQVENNLKCHDKVLVSLKSSTDQQKLSVLRRVLRFCTTPRAHTITLKKMAKIAGTNCPQNVLNVILNKMIEIGVLQKKKCSHQIDKRVLTEQLAYYFYKVQNSTQSQTQVLPYSLRSTDNFRRKNNLENCLNKKGKHSTAVFQEFLTCNSQNSQQSCDIFC